jgi:hypothetical protein
MPKHKSSRIAVWMLLDNGDVWEFCRERTLKEAMKTARTLGGRLTLRGHAVKQERVWIGPPAVLGEPMIWRPSR